MNLDRILCFQGVTAYSHTNRNQGLETLERCDTLNQISADKNGRAVALPPAADALFKRDAYKLAAGPHAGLLE